MQSVILCKKFAENLAKSVAVFSEYFRNDHQSVNRDNSYVLSPVPGHVNEMWRNRVVLLTLTLFSSWPVLFVVLYGSVRRLLPAIHTAIFTTTH